jgi:glycosyltransferase involved in cell wall biosynthesis
MNHVAFVIPGLDRIGGAERQVILLAQGLRQRGWRVSVVALSGTGGEAAAELTSAGAAFLTLEMRKGLADPRGWLRFNRWLKRESPDVLHAHLPHAVWLCRWSRLTAPVRVLVDTLHSSSTGTIGRHLGYRFNDWLADDVTAVSHAVANAHLSAGLASQITVIPNGVDVEEWRPDQKIRATMRRELDLNHEFLWFAAGRLDPVKDYPTLLSAMAQLPQTARLVIAGRGPLENELRALSKSLGIETRVRFLGFEPDVRRWMQAVDGFVLTSLWEGLPMALLEAAACGLPAVATDVLGTREVVQNGETGWLASGGDPSELAKFMSMMMATTAEGRKAMGERARQNVIEQFSLKTVLHSWESFYSELLSRNPTPKRYGRRASILF